MKVGRLEEQAKQDQQLDDVYSIKKRFMKSIVMYARPLPIYVMILTLTIPSL